MKTERADVNQLLQQMRQMQTQLNQHRDVQNHSGVEQLGAAAGPQALDKGQPVPSFSDMFRNAVDSVNETQQQSSALATAYEKGDPQVSLSQVMVASQKASVSFQAITQVRNKLVEAYQDIMNIPV